MLIEIAIGDAYGAGFEFSDRAKITAHNCGQYFVGHDLGISPGKYTDDTQMSVAIAEILLAKIAFTKKNCADAFVKTFQRDKRQGYSKKFQTLLENCTTGTELLQRINPDSKRNGAAMRSVPLGLIRSQEELLNAAKIQASVTHNTPEGIISSQIIALSANALIYQKVLLQDLPGIIQHKLNFLIDINWDQKVECDAMQTIHAVFSCLLKNRTMKQLLISCVDLSGDVDSVAAIALGLASLSLEYKNDLPGKLITSLENDIYGFDFLKQLDYKLQHL